MDKDIEINEETTRKVWIAPEATELKDSSSTESFPGAGGDAAG